MNRLLAEAETPTPTSIINSTNFPAMEFANLNTFINILAPTLTIGAVLIFGAMLLYAAYGVITAGGEAEKMESARQTATYAIIGLVIVVTAFLVVRLLAFIFSLETFI